MIEGYSDRSLRARVVDESVKVHWVREGNRLIPIPSGFTVRIGRDPLATPDEDRR